MKNKFVRRFVCLIFAAVCTFGLFACSQEDKSKMENCNADKSRLIGVGDIISECDPVRGISGVDGEYMAEKCEELGVTSVRVWMHFTSLFTRVRNTDEFVLNEEKCKIYHEYIDTLKAHGVERILSMNHTFLRPYGVEATNAYSIANPKTDYKTYVWMLEKYQWAYETLVAEFPDIEYWEVGNEFDHTGGEYLHDLTYAGSWSQQGVFTAEEAAYITADLCWYAKKGITSSNPQAKTVFPGMTMSLSFENTLNYFDWVYRHIEGGYLPTGKNYSDTNADDYFDIAAWHPYFSEGETVSRWKEKQDEIRNVMITHGDGDKAVWFTEMGFSDHVNVKTSDSDFENIATKKRNVAEWKTRIALAQTQLETEKDENKRAELQNAVAEWQSEIDAVLPMINKRLKYIADLTEEMLSVMESDMPYLETFFLFRMTELYTYNDLTTGEKSGETWSDFEENFGLFYAPNDPIYRGAAKPIAEVLKAFSEKYKK